MRTWDELERDFRALCEGGRDVRLDHQHGAAGEHWHIAGAISQGQRARFEALARMAGTKILNVPAVADYPEVVQEENPACRWYQALRALHRGYRFDWYGVQKDDRGNDAGLIFMGQMDGVFAASATLCLTMESLAAGPGKRLELMAAIPRYSGPSVHWQASTAFATQKEPDYAQAAHEAISAVEGMARLIVNDDSVTLGEALKELRAKGLIHGALVRCLEGLW